MTAGGTPSRAPAPPALSIVIPALDEARAIGATLATLGGARGVEVIVADGGSRDATRAIAASHAGVRCVVSERGRAAQMNAGAAVARAAVLVFLHADSILTAAAAERLPAALASRPDSPGGAFRFRLDSRRLRYRVIEIGVALRTSLLGLPYGDQGLFARRDAFDALGGFREGARGEDIDFVLRMRRLGPLYFPPDAIVTSARRWERDGFVKTTLGNWRFLARLAMDRRSREAARAPARMDPPRTAAEPAHERSREAPPPRARC